MNKRACSACSIAVDIFLLKLLFMKLVTLINCDTISRFDLKSNCCGINILFFSSKVLILLCIIFSNNLPRVGRRHIGL